MGENLNLRRSRNNAFNNALTLVQSWLTVVNAVFVLAALGLDAIATDYLIAIGYLLWSIT